VRDGDVGRHAQAHGGQIGLVDVREHPEMGEVGDVEERLRRRDPHALERVLLDHVAVDVGVQVERPADGAGALQALDVGRTDVPRATAAASRFDEVCAALGDGGNPAAGEAFASPRRQQVLLLGRDELGLKIETRGSPLRTSFPTKSTKSLST
jgi:hypothetical protein